MVMRSRRALQLQEAWICCFVGASIYWETAEDLGLEYLGLEPTPSETDTESSEESYIPAIEATLSTTMPLPQIIKFKCVSFDLQPTIKDTLALEEYSAAEVDNYWYSHLEMEAMIGAAMDPANERNLEVNGGSRGLEKYTTAGSTRLEVHRVQVVAAVLREQRRQSNWRRKNPFLIAQSAKAISDECQNLACLQGFNDEMEAYGVAATTDVVSLPKPGWISGLRQQMKAISDLAFLERHATYNLNAKAVEAHQKAHQKIENLQSTSILEPVVHR